ncbi:hypothetical protein DRE_03530 [Drechslerella stenobrocha 248]|uniref:Uncharacterized protein n=1 Tax=Drechslerella stenobrocha 248 TaxID=1043628 RepID=W7HSV3_9PEZI|nr:hypothetical protein DRE_03530 [Drechslerella stenobrocha 248]
MFRASQSGMAPCWGRIKITGMTTNCELDKSRSYTHTRQPQADFKKGGLTDDDPIAIEPDTEGSGHIKQQPGADRPLAVRTSRCHRLAPDGSRKCKCKRKPAQRVQLIQSRLAKRVDGDEATDTNDLDGEWQAAIERGEREANNVPYAIPQALYVRFDGMHLRVDPGARAANTANLDDIDDFGINNIDGFENMGSADNDPPSYRYARMSDSSSLATDMGEDPNVFWAFVSRVQGHIILNWSSQIVEQDNFGPWLFALWRACSRAPPEQDNIEILISNGLENPAETGPLPLLKLITISFIESKETLAVLSRVAAENPGLEVFAYEDTDDKDGAFGDTTYEGFHLQTKLATSPAGLEALYALLGTNEINAVSKMLTTYRRALNNAAISGIYFGLRETIHTHDVVAANIYLTLETPGSAEGSIPTASPFSINRAISNTWAVQCGNTPLSIVMFSVLMPAGREFANPLLKKAGVQGPGAEAGDMSWPQYELGASGSSNPPGGAAETVEAQDSDMEDYDQPGGGLFDSDSEGNGVETGESQDIDMDDYDEPSGPSDSTETGQAQDLNMDHFYDEPAGPSGSNAQGDNTGTGEARNFDIGYSAEPGESSSRAELAREFWNSRRSTIN